MPLSPFGANYALDVGPVKDVVVYVSLHFGVPDDDGSNEIPLGGVYARLGPVAATVAGRVLSIVGLPALIPVPGGQTVRYGGAWDGPDITDNFVGYDDVVVETFGGDGDYELEVFNLTL